MRRPAAALGVSRSSCALLAALCWACADDERVDRADAAQDAAALETDAEEADAQPPVTEAEGGMLTDACHGVPAGGRCLGDEELERCETDHGLAAHVVRERCAFEARCREEPERGAYCARSGGCDPEETACSDLHTRVSCAGGEYQHEHCATRCVASPLGAECAADAATRLLEGRVVLEVRRPNPELTDWAAQPEAVPGRGLWLLSFRGEQLLDAVPTSLAQATAGEFSVRVGAEPSGDDSLVVSCVGADRLGKLAYAVADPGFAPSATLHTSEEQAPEPRVWSWRFDTQELSGDAELRITERVGSGAAFVFEALHSVFSLGEQVYAPPRSQRVIAWLGLGTLWQCGACYTPRPVEVFGGSFEHQLRYDGSSDLGYWADTVTTHELGHYLMNAFGFLPREVSPRYFGEPTHPGLAWQEGWATFFSAWQRDDSVYYDKQAGGFFWFDIDARSYAFDDLVWQRPSAAAPEGLTQQIDENEVAAMLWEIYGTLEEREPLLAALASERVRVPPFERGYTRRTWSDPDQQDQFVDSGESTPHFADFLDALRCDDAISSTELDLVTAPELHYPYPSSSPLCR